MRRAAWCLVVAACGGPREAVQAPEVRGPAPEIVVQAVDAGAPVVIADPPDAPPAPTVDENDQGVGDSAARIKMPIRRNMVSLRRCYERFGAPADYRLRPRFVVEPDGSVSSVDFVDDGGAPPALASCLKDAIRGWKFPTGEGSVTVVYPVTFSNGQGHGAP